MGYVVPSVSKKVPLVIYITQLLKSSLTLISLSLNKTTMEFFSLSSILLLFLLSFTNPIVSLTDQPLISSLELHEEESCPYTVIVTTSCFSPDWSRDQITIALGDSDGNQV